MTSILNSRNLGKNLLLRLQPPSYHRSFVLVDPFLASVIFFAGWLLLQSCLGKAFRLSFPSWEIDRCERAPSLQVGQALLVGGRLRVGKTLLLSHAPFTSSASKLSDHKAKARSKGSPMRQFEEQICRRFVGRFINCLRFPYLVDSLVQVFSFIAFVIFGWPPYFNLVSTPPNPMRHCQVHLGIKICFFLYTLLSDFVYFFMLSKAFCGRDTFCVHICK